MLMFTFFHLLFDHFQFTLTWTYLSRFLCNLYSIELYFHLQSHTQLGVVFWFGSASSVFLELLVHSSLVAYCVPTDLGSSSFSVIFAFLPLMGFSRQEYWSDLPFPSPVDHILSELSTMSCPSWVALHDMAYSLIDLDKAVNLMIILVSLLWFWFSFCLSTDG